MEKAKENDTKKNKKMWAKIIKKSKEGLLIVPPHKADRNIETISLSWTEFNDNFDFDEKDKTHCYTKDGSNYEKVFLNMVTTVRTSKPLKKLNDPRIYNTKTSEIKKENNKKSSTKSEVKTEKKKTDVKKTVPKSYHEYTMTIGDMIKNNQKQ